MKEPSPEWTAQERLDLIAAIVEGRSFGISGFDFDKVRFLATMSAKFLEDNRRNLIERIEFE